MESAAQKCAVQAKIKTARMKGVAMAAQCMFTKWCQQVFG